MSLLFNQTCLNEELLHTHTHTHTHTHIYIYIYIMHMHYPDLDCVDDCILNNMLSRDSQVHFLTIE